MIVALVGLYVIGVAVQAYLIYKIREGNQIMNNTAQATQSLADVVTTLVETVQAETAAINAQAAAIAAEHAAITQLLADLQATNPTSDQSAIIAQIQTAISNAGAATSTITGSTGSIQSDTTAVTEALPPTLAVTLTVLNAPTTAAAGSDVILSAVVAEQPEGANPPTGTVTFMNGETTLGTGTLDQTGTATFTIDEIPADTYVLTAVYSGDSANAASTSEAVTLVAS